MESEGQESSDAPSPTAGEGQDRMSEKRKVIMAVTQMLDSGTLDERSSRLLAGRLYPAPADRGGPRVRVWQGGGHAAGCPPQGGSQWRTGSNWWNITACAWVV
jgi:hypothetical protein